MKKMFLRWSHIKQPGQWPYIPVLFNYNPSILRILSKVKYKTCSVSRKKLSKQNFTFFKKYNKHLINLYTIAKSSTKL